MTDLPNGTKRSLLEPTTINLYQREKWKNEIFQRKKSKLKDFIQEGNGPYKGQDMNYQPENTILNSYLVKVSNDYGNKCEIIGTHPLGFPIKNIVETIRLSTIRCKVVEGDNEDKVVKDVKAAQVVEPVAEQVKKCKTWQRIPDIFKPHGYDAVMDCRFCDKHRFLNAVHKKININTGEESYIECPMCNKMCYYQYLCVGCCKPSGRKKKKKHRRR